MRRRARYALVVPSAVIAIVSFALATIGGFLLLGGVFGLAFGLVGGVALLVFAAASR